MKIKLFLFLLLFSISIIGCAKDSKIKDIENKLSNGHYELSHRFPKNNENKIIPTPPDEIIIREDSVFYFEYEPYVPRKNGIVNNQYFIFDKKDSVKFEPYNNGFRTYTDTVVSVWYLVDNQGH
jgi:hypothetical protein